MAKTPDFRLLAKNSLDEIEQAVAQVYANRGADIGIHATALDKRRGALRDAAYLQLLFTWARLSPDANIHLLSNAQDQTSEILSEACSYSVGIGAIALSGGVYVNSEKIPRGVALQPATERIEAGYVGDFDKLMKGRTLDLLSVSGAKRQYAKPLFKSANSNIVRDKFDLKETVRSLAEKTGSVQPNSLDEKLITALAILMHELVENMQEHATSDVNRKAYRRHAELFTASWLTFSEEESQNDLASNEKLKAYWRKLAVTQPGDRKVAGICFSFLDSGPGMAARLRETDIFNLTFEDERIALNECLRIRVSSKKEYGTGGGLQAVLAEVAQSNGFVRVRSGRQAIYRCFAPGDKVGELCEGFEDWFDGKGELLRVAGTLVSVFIPIPRPTR